MNQEPEFCPFCSPKAQERSFLESNNFLAIYNIAPVLPGHSLIISKAHIQSFLDLSTEEIFEFIQLSRKATKILMKTFQSCGFDWTIQDNQSAGQTIPHFHLHIIPRKLNDLHKPGDWLTALMEVPESNDLDSRLRNRLSSEEIQKYVDKIRRVAFDESSSPFD